MSTVNEEKYILKGILSFDDYAMKYMDKLEDAFFSEQTKLLLKIIKAYHLKYCKIPNVRTMIDVLLPQNTKKCPEKLDDYIDILQSIMTMDCAKDDFYKWLEDETRVFIKNKRLEDALMKSMPLLSANNVDEAVRLINQAASVTFDDNLGLDYFGDVKSRMLRLKQGDNVIPTGYQMVDTMLNGGWRNKTLTVFGAGTNVGKTLILADLTCKLLKQGMNGLYITLEIYQDSLANRLDANLTDIEMNELKNEVDVLEKKLEDVKKIASDKGIPYGEIIIKEYPPTSLNCNQILAYVRELQLKKGFKPAFICVDYLALMAPNGKSFSDNTYGKLKTVAEELRAVACVLDLPIFTATQVNRDAYGSSEVGMEKTSDSMGIPMTADIMIMVSRDEICEKENKMYWYFAKSRFSKNGGGFYMNVQYSNMRLTPPVENDSSYETINQTEKKEKNSASRKIDVKKTVHAANGNNVFSEADDASIKE
jgi:KaiC/GvpD/RAD55 family RecA-like ATPase